MTIAIKRTIKEELEIVRKRHGGILKPEFVVEYARRTSTELHRHFTWDDTEAARKWRLTQAMLYIRVCCHYVGEEGRNQRIRTYVSLGSDRGTGTYRALVDVLQDKSMKAQMLEDAKRELNAFKIKYGMLLRVELADVLDAIERVSA